MSHQSPFQPSASAANCPLPIHGDPQAFAMQLPRPAPLTAYAQPAWKSRISVAEPAVLLRDADVPLGSMTGASCGQPLPGIDASTSADAHAARGANGVKTRTSEGLDSENTCRWVAAGPDALTGAAEGQSIAHTGISSQAPQTGGSASVLSPRVQDSRHRICPASDTEAAPLATQSLGCHAPPVTTAQSMLDAIPDQLGSPSPPRAAPQSQAGDASPRLSAGRQAGVQQQVLAPLQTAPSAGGKAAALPPLPRLPAVTTASLPPLAEVLAPVALPAAFCLIGAGSPDLAWIRRD